MSQLAYQRPPGLKSILARQSPIGNLESPGRGG